MGISSQTSLQEQSQQIEDLFLYPPDKISTPIPWETCRKHFVTRSIICFAITVLLALGATALASYAILNQNWNLFGISFAIVLLSVIIALFLALPIKNKIYGITLIDEISQDINNIGKETLKSYGEMFKKIKRVQIPELEALHQKLCDKIEENNLLKKKLEESSKFLKKQLQPQKKLPSAIPAKTKDDSNFDEGLIELEDREEEIFLENEMRLQFTEIDMPTPSSTTSEESGIMEGLTGLLGLLTGKLTRRD